MERFVFVTAVTIAIILAVVHFFGGLSWSIDVDGDFDGGRMDPIVEVSAGQLAPTTYAAAGIEIKYAAAHVVVVPEDRTDMVVEIDNPGRTPMPEVRMDRDALVIDGRLRGRIRDCHDGAVDVKGYGDIARAELPQVRIRAPRTLEIEVGGASSIDVGPSQSLDVSFSSCATADIADVTDELDVSLAGSGQVRAGAVRRLTAEVAGSGEVQVGAVAEDASIDLAGSGEVRLASLSGSLQMDSAGSGGLIVSGGAVTEADIDLAGSGDVSIAAPVQELNVSIVGSGDVEVNGVVGDIDADIAGSGGVRAQAVTGALRQEVWGSGEVEVGSRQAPPAPAPLPPVPAPPPAPTNP